MSGNFDEFLQQLKPLNDSGLINTLGVIATFAAVFVALLPTFWKWKKRPKFAVLLKAVEIQNTIGGLPGQPQISTTARMLVKNAGGSAALNVRAVITDFYIQTSSKPLSFLWRDYEQKTLAPSDKDLPAGLSFPVSLVGRFKTGHFDTGFILGGVPRISFGIASASPKRLALFKGEKPGLYHYCYSIADPADAVARLKAAGLAPKRRGDRVYFDDPDGIECQVASA